MLKFEFYENFKCKEFDTNATLDELRNLLSDHGRLMPENNLSQRFSVVFGNSAVRAWYAEDLVLKGVEFYYPEAQIILCGEGLIGSTVKKAVSVIAGLTDEICYESDLSGFYVADGKVRFYSPDYIEHGEDAKIMSVYIDLECRDDNCKG